MTPEQFIERIPNWRDDAAELCAAAVLQMIQDDQIPVPWTDETLAMIEKIASEMTIQVFQPYRQKMGDAIFGELVRLVGREAKKCAIMARAGAASPSSRLQ
jgi:hypothetical protein